VYIVFETFDDRTISSQLEDQQLIGVEYGSLHFPIVTSFSIDHSSANSYSIGLANALKWIGLNHPNNPVIDEKHSSDSV
jgi:hypothetical protein